MQIYIICVSDNSVEEVSKMITKKDCLVAHTSGSLPKEILAGITENPVFILYKPFQNLKNWNIQNSVFHRS
jgi:hypothetical protein